MKAFDKHIELILNQLMWDYDIPAFELYNCLQGTTPIAGFYTRENLLLKVFNNLSYSDIIRVLDIEEIKVILTPQFIQKLRFPNYRQKYEILRRILHKEALPASKWHDRANSFPQYPILSKRWYGAQ